MPRAAREKSSTGIYHIMVKGINRQNIFKDDEDRQKYIEIINRYKKEMGFKIYAYCLMNNHVHLLLKESEEKLSNIFKKIGTSYAYYFNWKYERAGHLFQDRYKSEVVENDSYFLTVIRYIHQNPVKAGISGIESYKWSSYNNYIKSQGIVDTDFLLEILGSDREKALEIYTSYMNESNDDKCLEIENQIKLTDEKARELIKSIGHLNNIFDIQKLEMDKRNEILKAAKEIEGISVLQISRITGINRAIVTRV